MESQSTEELWQQIREQQRRIEKLEATRVRRFSLRLPRRLAPLALGAVVALSLTGGAFASIPGSDGVISGCYLPSSGVVRVIDASTQICRTNERAISWYGSGASIGAGTITGVLSISQGGTGSSTKNFVDLSTDQTVGGTKTFSSTIVGNLSGNVTGDLHGTADSVAHGIYDNQSYNNPAWLASLSGGKISGNIAGNAAGFTGSLGGDVSGPQGQTTVTALRNHTISATTPAAGQVLGFNGNVWTPTTVSTPSPAYTEVTTTLTAPGSIASDFSVGCPSDFPHIISGGYYNPWTFHSENRSGVSIGGERPDLVNNAWVVSYANFDAADHPINAYALCSTQ